MSFLCLGMSFVFPKPSLITRYFIKPHFQSYLSRNSSGCLWTYLISLYCSLVVGMLKSAADCSKLKGFGGKRFDLKNRLAYQHFLLWDFALLIFYLKSLAYSFDFFLNFVFRVKFKSHFCLKTKICWYLYSFQIFVQRIVFKA